MNKKKPGFTLIEIIIVLALTVTILGIASSMFITGNKVFSDSDIKSTLQIEGQAIQEKISDIGMQATGIGGLTVASNASNLNNGNFSPINDITISSYKYDEQGNPISHGFVINKVSSGDVYKNGNSIYELLIDGEVISTNVESVSIDNNTINATSLENVNSVEFSIVLKKESSYSSIEQPVDFRVTFRNK